MPPAIVLALHSLQRILSWTCVSVLAKPFEEQPAFAHYMDPPQVHERVGQTFCGT